MLKTAVCFKYVVDEADLGVDQSTRKLYFVGGKPVYKISDYDRNAIEAAVCLAESNDGSAVAISAGGAEVEGGFKDALSRGCTSGLYVSTDDVELCSASAAKVLAKAVEAEGGFELIVFGEGSSDGFSQQVGPRVAALLGIPFISCACKIEIQNDSVLVERKLEDCVEVVTCPLPVAVSVTSDANKPRIPGMKQILAAKKKEIKKTSATELGLDAGDMASVAAFKAVEGSVSDRKKNVLDGDIENAVRETVRALVREGCVG